MDELETPNCRTCLVPLIVAGTEDHPYWACPDCKIALLS